ncbi:hypothetical protein SAMN05216371_8202 [Streptomyces sp. TLI_053]|nr:hypothetical protein SAMN05216371_8202 [Streptomyces sp. TLI_053]
MGDGRSALPRSHQSRVFRRRHVPVVAVRVHHQGSRPCRHRDSPIKVRPDRLAARKLRRVGFYLYRQDSWSSWGVEEFLNCLGATTPLDRLRAELAEALGSKSSTARRRAGAPCCPVRELSPRPPSGVPEPGRPPALSPGWPGRLCRREHRASVPVPKPDSRVVVGRAVGRNPAQRQERRARAGRLRRLLHRSPHREETGGEQLARSSGSTGGRPDRTGARPGPALGGGPRAAASFAVDESGHLYALDLVSHRAVRHPSRAVSSAVTSPGGRSGRGGRTDTIPRPAELPTH